MTTCEHVRAALALDPLDGTLHDHLAACPACAAYQRRSQHLDALLRDELRWQAPAALTAQLLAIAAGPVLAVAAARPRPPRWYVNLVLLLTCAAVGVSLVVVWRFISLAAGQLGVHEALAWLLDAPGHGLLILGQMLPESRPLIDFAAHVRDQSMWVLLAALLWAVAERTTRRGGLNEAQIQL
jgi:hypothetical protein